MELEPSKFNVDKAIQCFEKTQNWASYIPSTIDNAMDSQSPTLGAMKKYIGESVTVEVLSEIIMASLTLLNLEKSVTKNQIQYTSILLMQENLLMTLADWQTCMKMGIMNQYDDKEAAIYGRVDINTISNWQKLYWEQRLKIGETRAMSQKKHKEQDLKDYSPPPEILKSIQDRTKKLQKKNENEFNPDSVIIEFWRSEWSEISEPKPTFEQYQKLQIIKLSKK